MILEKDFWVCWLLGILYESEFAGSLVFKGGTSLSKVFGFMDRFSEVVDLSVSPQFLGLPEVGASRNQADKWMTKAEVACSIAVKGQITPKLETVVTAVLGQRAEPWFEYLTDPGTHSPVLLFHYPSCQPVGFEYLKRSVKMEFGSLTDQQPVGHHAVRPWLADILPAAFSDWKCEVIALEVKRSFGEKATILHAEYHRLVRFNLGEPMVGFVVFKQVKAYILDVDLCVQEQKTYLRQMEMVMNAFLKNNQGNFLVGIVTSAGKVDVGLLVCLKECCLSPGPGVGVGCGVSQVYLRPGTALPNVGDRIACFGRLVNASEIGAVMRGATWKPEADMYLTDKEVNHDDDKEGATWKPESNPHQIENEVFQVDDNEHIQFEIRQDSEMVLTHLQAATGILAGLSYAMCDDEMLVKSLEGLRQISKDSSLWPKDFIGAEYEADACEKALAYFFYSLAEIANAADRRIAERRSPGQILDAALIISVRNRIEAALVTLAEMKEARILSGESLFPY